MAEQYMEATVVIHRPDGWRVVFPNAQIAVSIEQDDVFEFKNVVQNVVARYAGYEYRCEIRSREMMQFAPEEKTQWDRDAEKAGTEAVQELVIDTEPRRVVELFLDAEEDE